MQRRSALWTAAFVLLALGLPAYALRFDAPLGWVGSTLFLCIGILAAGASLSRIRLGQLVAGLGAAAMALANALVAVSYYLQGDGVNELFLFHFRPDVLEVLPAYKGMLAAGSIYVVVVVLVALRAIREPRFRLPNIASMLLLLVSLAMFTPLRQLLGTLDAFSTTASDPSAEELLTKLNEHPAEETAPPESVEAVPIPPPSPRNLVLIYLEGLEQVYLDETRFPGLMPRLREMQRETITFTNMHGEFLGGTIFGIFASQCGWPLHWDLFKSTSEGDDFLPEFRCLGDALKEKGYTSVFMGGAPVRFGRKDSFFASHGFSSVLGKRSLRERLADPAYVHPWGLYDDSLFDLVRDELVGLAESQPFFLNLITVGTHYPGYVSASCPDYAASGDDVLNAAHCTDFLVTRFIETIRRSALAENTVIAVMSDHLMWEGGARDHELGLRMARPLTFMLEVPGEQGRVNAAHGTHFDVPATLLSVLDVGFEGRFGLGTTLMDGDGFLWTEKASLDDAGRTPQSDIDRSKAIKTFLASREVRSFVEEFSR